jgi:hypothetical protein
MVLGVEYTAALPFVTSVPIEGVDQVTPLFELPVTVAVSAWVCDCLSEALAGFMETATGIRFTIALADLVGSATLVPVIVTVSALGIRVGAVYRPAAEMVPVLGVSDHVTRVCGLPVTAAVNC